MKYISPNSREGITAYDPLADENFYVEGSSLTGSINVNVVEYAPRLNAFATGQVTIPPTATQIVPSNPTRCSVTIVNLGTTDVFIGNSSVTTSNGQLLLGIRGGAITLSTTAAVFGIVSAGSQSVSYEEEY